MKISLCMMVRNEAEQIGRAIASAAGLADEAIVVDTGSTDGTLQAARELGAVVIEGGDRRNKAASRNMGIDAATGDMAVILDADEQIADPVGLRAFLERTDAEALYVRETFMNGKGPTLSFSQMRCWKRDAYRYKYRAHELPVPTNGKWGKVERTNFVWEHRPPGGRAWKREHMLMLLLMDVEENPGDPRPVYYLGREYMYLQAWRMCLEKMSEYIRIAPLGDTDISEAWGNMATCHKQLGETSAMTMCLWRALAEQPHRRDWYGWLAEYYHERKDHALAAGLLKAALELPRPETGYINEQWHGAYIYDLLARCLWYAGKKSDGLPFAQRAVELSPDDDHLRDNLRWFESEGAA